MQRQQQQTMRVSIFRIVMSNRLQLSLIFEFSLRDIPLAHDFLFFTRALAIDVMDEDCIMFRL